MESLVKKIKSVVDSVELPEQIEELENIDLEALARDYFSVYKKVFEVANYRVENEEGLISGLKEDLSEMLCLALMLAYYYPFPKYKYLHNFALFEKCPKFETLRILAWAFGNNYQLGYHKWDLRLVKYDEYYTENIALRFGVGFDVDRTTIMFLIDNIEVEDFEEGVVTKINTDIMIRKYKISENIFNTYLLRKDVVTLKVKKENNGTRYIVAKKVSDAHYYIENTLFTYDNDVIVTYSVVPLPVGLIKFFKKKDLLESVPYFYV